MDVLDVCYQCIGVLLLPLQLPIFPTQIPSLHVICQVSPLTWQPIIARRSSRSNHDLDGKTGSAHPVTEISNAIN